MWHVATDVARSMIRLSVHLLVTRGCCAKTAEPVLMPFGGLTPVGSKEPCIRWGQDGTNPFAAVRGDKMVMQPCTLLWICINISCLIMSFTDHRMF